MGRIPPLRKLLGALFAVAWLAGAAAGLPAANPAPWARGESRAEDLTIRLVTIGPGDPVYTWWGHTALIVEDRRLGQSRFYNYGLFSFEQSNFALNFAMGRLWFEVGAGDVSRELEGYRRENRDIRLQVLNLSPRRSLELARALEENIRPENRTYLYDHYADNCTTRVRDLIDRAVGGELAAASTAAGRMTLRQHTRRFTAGHPFTEWLLMFLMSGRIDRPITRWQEMFLPVELERSAERLVYRDETGREQPLVLETTVVHRAVGRRPVAEGPPPGRAAGLAPGLLLAAAAALLGAWRRRGGPAGRIAFDAFAAACGLAVGLLGSVLFFLSVFTDHAVTYGNLNLLLANPLALAAFVLGLAAPTREGRHVETGQGGPEGLEATTTEGRRGARAWAARLWGLLAVLAAALLILKALPGVVQENTAAVLTFVPVLFVLAAELNLGAQRPARRAPTPGGRSG